MIGQTIRKIFAWLFVVEVGIAAFLALCWPFDWLGSVFFGKSIYDFLGLISEGIWQMVPENILLEAFIYFLPGFILLYGYYCYDAIYVPDSGFEWGANEASIEERTLWELKEINRKLGEK